MSEWLFIYKIAFLICLLLASLSLVTWYFKDLPSYIRKPLVLLIYPISCIPRMLISINKIHTKLFWHELKINFLIAWNGHKHGNHKRTT